MDENTAEPTPDIWWTSIQLTQLQQEDPEVGEFVSLRAAFPTEKPPFNRVTGSSEAKKKLWFMWDDIYYDNGVLYRRSPAKDELREFHQLLLSVCLREEFLQLVHAGTTGGHLGIARTRAQLCSRAFWHGWPGYVERFVRSFVPCARYKKEKSLRQGGLCPISTGLPFEVISLDLTGPHPKSSNGYLYILTVIDHFTKYAFAEPMRNQEAGTVAKVLLDRVFAFVGLPQRILTDQGTNFESSLFK